MEIYRQETEFTPEQAGYEKERLSVLEDHFAALIEDNKLQCASYLFAHDNKIFASASMGKLNYKEEDKRPFFPDSLYGIYSITKLVTAVAIMQLVENGKILLNQKVCSILKEFDKKPFNQIEIIHLLTHTSGLYFDEGCKPERKRREKEDLFSSKNWIKCLLDVGLVGEPGKEWMYCSIGYNVLGEIITRVTGVFCHDYITEHVLKPCGMTETSWGYKKEFMDRYCSRFEWTDNFISQRWKQKNPEVPRTWNGLVSSNSDLMKFSLMLLNNGKIDGKHILGRKAIEFIRINHTPGVKNYCWNAGGAEKSYGLGPDVISVNSKDYLVTPGSITHEGWGTCATMVDFTEKFVAVWCAQFKGNIWLNEPLRNAVNIMWSGIL